MRVRLNISAALALFLLGCSTRVDQNIEPPKALLVGWSHYDLASDPERIRFYINGRYVGQGTNGAEAVIAAIESYPSGALILIQPNNLPFDDGGVDYVPPFAALELRSELLAAAGRHGHTLYVEHLHNGGLFKVEPIGPAQPDNVDQQTTPYRSQPPNLYGPQGPP